MKIEVKEDAITEGRYDVKLDGDTIGTMINPDNTSRFEFDFCLNGDGKEIVGEFEYVDAAQAMLMLAAAVEAAHEVEA